MSDVMVRPQAATFLDLLNSKKGQIERVLPKHLKAEWMLQIAVNVWSRTPGLKECTPESVVSCIVQASELGLPPCGTMALAHLVPFKNKKTGRTDCQLIIDYKGYIELALRSRKVKSIQAEVVHEKDFFEIEFGTHKKLLHRPHLTGNRGETILAYAIAELTSGGTQFIVMTAEDINNIRERSPARDTGMWAHDTPEAWKKTAIRRLRKQLPFSIGLSKADEIDAQAEAGEAQVFVIPEAAPVAHRDDLDDEEIPR